MHHKQLPQALHKGEPHSPHKPKQLMCSNTVNKR